MTVEELNNPVVSNIENISKEKGLKQGFIAEKAEIPEKTFSDMLNGRCIIKACHIPKLAKALGVTPNELFA